MQYDLRSLDQSGGEKAHRGYFITCDPINGEVVSSVLKKAKSGSRTDRFIHYEAENENSLESDAVKIAIAPWLNQVSFGFTGAEQPSQVKDYPRNSLIFTTKLITA